jgi:hypothetical protein
VAGRGIIVTFQDASGAGEQVGFERLTEGTFDNGRWQEGRWLNGDESHQGRHVQMPADSFGIQKVTLYKFR